MTHQHSNLSLSPKGLPVECSVSISKACERKYDGPSLSQVVQACGNGKGYEDNWGLRVGLRLFLPELFLPNVSLYLARCVSSPDSTLCISSYNPSPHLQYTYFMPNSSCDLQSKPKVKILKFNFTESYYESSSLTVFPVFVRKIWSVSWFSQSWNFLFSVLFSERTDTDTFNLPSLLKLRSFIFKYLICFTHIF